jgi:hypothetical protein
MFIQLRAQVCSLAPYMLTGLHARWGPLSFLHSKLFYDLRKPMFHEEKQLGNSSSKQRRPPRLTFVGRPATSINGITRLTFAHKASCSYFIYTTRQT